MLYDHQLILTLRDQVCLRYFIHTLQINCLFIPQRSLIIVSSFNSSSVYCKIINVLITKDPLSFAFDLKVLVDCKIHLFYIILNVIFCFIIISRKAWILSIIIFKLKQNGSWIACIGWKIKNEFLPKYKTLFLSKATQEVDPLLDLFNWNYNKI